MNCPLELFHGIVPRVAELRGFYARQILEQVLMLFLPKDIVGSTGREAPGIQCRLFGIFTSGGEWVSQPVHSFLPSPSFLVLPHPFIPAWVSLLVLTLALLVAGRRI